MKSILVCIISAQLLPNYLYVVDKADQADKVMLITSKGFKNKANYASRVFQGLRKEVSLLVLSDYGVEERWNQLIAEVRAKLSKENKYLVNLTGGTKYMAMAVQKAFEPFTSDFFYIPLPKNYMLRFMQGAEGERELIRHRVGVKECLAVFGAEVQEDWEPLFSEGVAGKCMELFQAGRLERTLFFNLERRQRDPVYNERGVAERFERYLDNLQRRRSYVDDLLKTEVAYLRGGWFEEYVYYFIKKHVKPDDIALNVKLDVPAVRGGEVIKNELDVCFTRNNRFFVIECKAFSGGGAKDSTVVYKSRALKESILGMAATSYICAVGDIGEREVAMGVEWFGSECFLEPEKVADFVGKIIESSSF
jgi:hypothetical protein